MIIPLDERSFPLDTTESLSQPRADDAKGDSGTLQRGLAILRLLAEALTPLSSREIAEAVGLNDSTTHRLLQTLKDEGYVCRDEAKRYHASPDALLPLSLYHPLHQLRREVSDTLRGLRDLLHRVIRGLALTGAFALTVSRAAGFPEILCAFETEADAAAFAALAPTEPADGFPGFATQRVFHLDAALEAALRAGLLSSGDLDQR